MFVLSFQQSGESLVDGSVRAHEDSQHSPVSGLLQGLTQLGEVKLGGKLQAKRPGRFQWKDVRHRSALGNIGL